MSAKKSFSGTPYARPPSTPRQQQLARQDSTPGSILKTLFSPSNWFGRKSGSQQSGDTDHDEGEEVSGSESSDEEEEDEEEQMGLQSGQQYPDQVQKDNTAKIYPSLPQTPAQSSRPQSGSPNAILASFFSNKGDTPLSEIELEGVKAMLAKQTSSSSPQQQVQQAPSYATPARRPYQPIFTPAKIGMPTTAATEVRKVRRTGYTPSTSAASPFKRPTMRTSFVQPPARIVSTPTKYALKASIASTTTPLENGKRALDELAAPLAKRSRQDAEEPKDSRDESTTSTGSRTAASMLEILDSDAADASVSAEQTQTVKSPEQLKSMLNPYASSANPRKPVASPRRTPARKEPRSAMETIAKNDAIEKKIPYQPKKSSGLSNSFSAEDEDVSLFSPKRRIQSPSKAATQESQHKAHGGFTFGGPKDQVAAAETPTKAGPSAISAFGSPAPKASLFQPTDSHKVHSMTPTFSFAAPQVPATTTTATAAATSEELTQNSDAEDSVQKPLAPVFTFGASSNDDASHKQHGGFTFGQSTTADVRSTELDSSPQSKTNGHASHGGFTASQDTPAAPSFGLGTSTTSDKSEHQSHGGFAFNTDTPSSKPPANLSSSATKSPTVRDHDSDTLVHQLRDGTEYISPSKASNNKAPASDENTTTETPAATSGFVFQPTHSKTPSSFSFSAYKAPSTSQPAPGGFSFDATKKVDIVGKTIGDVATKPSPAPMPVSATSQPTETTKERVLALPHDRLQSFEFTQTTKLAPTKLMEKVLSAELITFRYSAPSSAPPKTLSATQPTSGVFDWSAAGLKKPEIGWSCEVCMVSNKPDTSKCISCESDRPDIVPTSTTTQLPPTNTNANAESGGGGGFNWAAAGMSKPSDNWTCGTCMISNPMDKSICLACESEKP